MKKAICFLLALAFILVLCACGSQMPASEVSPPSTTAPVTPHPSHTPFHTPTITPKPVPTPTPKYNYPLESIGLEPANEHFSSESRIQFCLFDTVQDASRALHWNVAQSTNPELSFDPSKQSLDYARFYLTYYAQCTKEDARTTLEDYTSTLIEIICTTFQDVQIDHLDFCWKVPAVDETSLYAATFWGENKDGLPVCGDGSGIIYQ